jgi:serine/threonine protein kinase
VVRAGAEVQIVWSLAYTPPEIVEAVEGGQRRMAADTATDVWALGAIAFELLTKSRIFPPYSMTREDAFEQLLGRELLPWEAGAPGAEAKVKALRGLKKVVLGCLDRDPAKRPTAAGVLATMHELFELSESSVFDTAAQPAI